MRANLLFRESTAGAAAGSPVAVPAQDQRAAPRVAPRSRGLLERIDDWFRRQREREIAAYLATSQNVYELESRMRDLSRGTPHPYY